MTTKPSSLSLRSQGTLLLGGTLTLGAISILPRLSAAQADTFLAVAPVAAPAGTVRATIHAGAPRQKIYGFGGSITYAADSTFDFAGREATYEAIFSELKLDILRLRNWHGYAAAGSQERFEKITQEYASAARRWSAPARRGPDKGPVRIMFTSWSPPEYLKSNNRVSGREDGTEKGLENVTLARDKDGKYRYAAYANWWLASLAKYRSLAGGKLPDYIALQNEQDFLPSYEGMKFLPTEGIGRGGFHFAGYDRAIAAVQPRLQGAFGAETPKIVGPETFTLQVNDKGILNVRPYADPATPQGRETLSHLWGISFHFYGSGAGPKDNDPGQKRFQNALTVAAKTYHDPQHKIDKPLFQTEYIEGDTLTKLGGIMHESLTKGEVGAYLVWVLTRKYDPSSSMLVSFSLDGSREIRRHDRFWAMKHFSYFVGEGWRRVEAEVTDPEVKLSAYRSPSGGSLVAVAINPTDTPRRVVFAPDGAGFKSGGAAETYRSTEGDAGEHWHKLGPLAPGQAVEMPPKSMVTLRFTKRAGR
jgi:glucuronoarabinoxylan endo-1,4-beta-xylanase